MDDSLLNGNNKKFEQLNLTFYKLLTKWLSHKQEQQFYDKINKKQKMIEERLKDLCQQELMEWVETLAVKYRQLYNSRTSQTTDQLISTLYILVHCCKRANIPNNHQEVHNIIKETYYEIYKDKIVDLFKKSGFQTQEFQVFEYQDPFYTRIWRAIFD